MASSVTNMPLDIWREILVRLPAESLIRGRAVSKGWRAMIDDPCFVRAHTNNLQQQQLSSAKIIFQNKTYCSVGSCYSLDLEALISCSNGHQVIAATPLDLDFISDSPEGLSLTVVAACNGLVLTEKPSLTIWNPLTHERLDLPRGGFKKNVLAIAIGLGYDSANDDYKAVVILISRETHVYSLKSDTWRRIMDCPRGPDRGRPGFFVCGALNWLSVEEVVGYGDEIVALDLGTEKYSLLQMPHKTRRIKNKLMLNELGVRLALCDSGFHSYLDVWVMKDYGYDDSWFKLFSIKWEQGISVWRGFLRPVSFVVKEKLIFLEDSFGMFFLFDVETKSLKWVRIDGSIIKIGSFLHAKQMFVGNIFRLHANCDGVFRKIACTKKKKKVNCGGVFGMIACTKKKKKKKEKEKASAEDVELVFCIRDANGTCNVSCSRRGCLSGENEDGT